MIKIEKGSTELDCGVKPALVRAVEQLAEGGGIEWDVSVLAAINGIVIRFKQDDLENVWSTCEFEIPDRTRRLLVNKEHEDEDYGEGEPAWLANSQLMAELEKMGYGVSLKRLQAHVSDEGCFSAPQAVEVYSCSTDIVEATMKLIADHEKIEKLFEKACSNLFPQNVKSD